MSDGHPPERNVEAGTSEILQSFEWLRKAADDVGSLPALVGRAMEVTGATSAALALEHADGLLHADVIVPQSAGADDGAELVAFAEANRRSEGYGADSTVAEATSSATVITVPILDAGRSLGGLALGFEDGRRLADLDQELHEIAELVAAIVTFRSQLEEAARHRIIVDSSIVGVAAGRGRLLTEADDATLRILGRHRADLADGIDLVAATPEEYRRLDQLGADIVRHGGEFPFVQKVFRRPDGTEVPVVMAGFLRNAEPFAWLSLIIERADPPITESLLARELHAALDQREAAAREALNATRIAVERRNLIDALVEGVLPQSIPHVEDYAIGAEYRPAAVDAVVGGDWYDMSITETGSLWAMVGDAAGNGVSAAGLMSRLSSAARVGALLDPDPGAVTEILRKVIRAHDPEAMATTLVLLADPRSGSITWRSAGHPPPLIRRSDGKVEVLEGPIGPPLIIDGVRDESVGQASIEPGDTVVIYTDGLIERRKESIDMGIRRAVRVLEDLPPGATVHAFCSALIGICPDASSTDDLCVVAITAR